MDKKIVISANKEYLINDILEILEKLFKTASETDDRFNYRKTKIKNFIHIKLIDNREGD